MRTEQVICNKLLDLMETTSYTKIKVSDFVKYAQISRSSFYFYFSSIDAVVDQLENDFVALLPDPSQTAANIASRTAAEGYEYSKLANSRISKKLRTFRILSSPNGSPNFQRKLYMRVKQINTLYYGISSASDLYIDFLSEYYAGAQWGIYYWWSRHEDEVSLDDINRYVASIPTRMSDFDHPSIPKTNKKESKKPL